MKYQNAAWRLGAGKLLGVFTLFFAVGITTEAYASDYGCKVLLCLANPNGPKAVSECVPPIERLYDDLAHGRGFPSCEMSGSSYAKQGMSYYDPCPSGTTALPAGSYAIQGSQVPKNQWWGSQQTVYVGIGDGDDLRFFSETGDSLGTKTCVGNQVGTTYTSFGSSDGGLTTIQAGVYDSVVLLDPQGSPRIIDVFIDNSLYRRVRW